jgi:hypothetical protein
VSLAPMALLNVPRLVKASKTKVIRTQGARAYHTPRVKTTTKKAKESKICVPGNSANHFYLKFGLQNIETRNTQESSGSHKNAARATHHLRALEPHITITTPRSHVVPVSLAACRARGPVDSSIIAQCRLDLGLSPKPPSCSKRPSALNHLQRSPILSRAPQKCTRLLQKQPHRSLLERRV